MSVVSGLSRSGGQQQRLCIARSTATEPEVQLMDEPCSALDPVATRKLEELEELEQRDTIVLVTHNLPQAARVADTTEFMYVDTTRGGRTGIPANEPRSSISAATLAKAVACAGRYQRQGLLGPQGLPHAKPAAPPPPPLAAVLSLPAAPATGDMAIGLVAGGAGAGPPASTAGAGFPAGLGPAARPAAGLLVLTLVPPVPAMVPCVLGFELAGLPALVLAGLPALEVLRCVLGSAF